MKSLIIIAFVAFSITSSIAQEKNIVTQSVTLDNLIPFIVKNFHSSNDASENRNITFLLQVSSEDKQFDDSIILKQAFKLLSTRLTEDDKISIVTYSGFNGVALKQSSPKELKRIYYALSSLKSSIKEFHNDGIQLAYDYANKNFDEESINTVVMVRNTNLISNSQVSNHDNLDKPRKKRNNVVLITAISLLPEIISVIKKN